MMMPDDKDDSRPTTVDRDSRTMHSAADSTVRARSAVPRYRRLAQLGSGGMSTVLLSRDETLQRDVAVKTTSASKRHNPMITAAIAREAVIQAGLEHPAIPPVYDLGVDDHGRSFFTMRKIEGVSLETVLRNLRRGEPTFVERFGQRRLLTAFSTVCGAVAFAHSKGVLHRDVKPSNIMFGEFGEVYLLDFGVAKMDAGPDEPWSEDALVGTIGYGAPEQLRGQGVDERSDVYALGAVLFEILTQEHLHSREEALALATTLSGVDVRARTRSLRLDMPPELEALCVRATALHSADRLSSARELRDAIERFLDGERDLARRRALADEYAEGALKALRSKGGRDAALESANRALALEPMNAVASKVLAQLATTARPGPDAERSQEEANLGLRSLLFRSSAMLFALWVAAAAAATLLGIRDRRVTVVGIVVALIGAVCIFIRARTSATWSRISVFTAGLAAAGLTSTLFGPFVLVPSYLACLSVIAIVSALPASAAVRAEPRHLRTFFLVGIVFTLVLPVALELFGIVPPSMAFRDGTIVLLPRAVDFPRIPTIFVLLLSNVIGVILPAMIAARARDYAVEVQRRAFEAASTLSQLVPRSARRVANPPTDR